MILSVDPGRVYPAISRWEGGVLKKTYKPQFKGKTGEKRLKQVQDWLNNVDGNIDLLIVECNSKYGGSDIGCYFAAIAFERGIEICIVSPIHVAMWASKFYNSELTRIPRNVKKKRTKELVEILTEKENLTFDEADSILNYFYWYNVKSDIRHRNNQPESNDSHQPGTGAPVKL